LFSGFGGERSDPLYLGLNAVFGFVSRLKWGLKGAKTLFFAVFVFFRIYGVFFGESNRGLRGFSQILTKVGKSCLSRGGGRGILTIFFRQDYMIFLAGDPPSHEAMVGQGYLALVSLVLAVFVCEHPRPPIPHPQELCSLYKAK
jgi:hypothetical protein